LQSSEGRGEKSIGDLPQSFNGDSKAQGLETGRGKPEMKMGCHSKKNFGARNGLEPMMESKKGKGGISTHKLTGKGDAHPQVFGTIKGPNRWGEDEREGHFKYKKWKF